SRAGDGIRDDLVTGVQTCALPISLLFTTTISSTTSVDAKSRMAARMDSRSLYVGKTTEMRQPRHDTPLSLPAEHPREALARDEALLDEVQPDGPPLERWYVAASSAVV